MPNVEEWLKKNKAKMEKIQKKAEELKKLSTQKINSPEAVSKEARKKYSNPRPYTVVPPESQGFKTDTNHTLIKSKITEAPNKRKKFPKIRPYNMDKSPFQPNALGEKVINYESLKKDLLKIKEILDSPTFKDFLENY